MGADRRATDPVRTEESSDRSMAVFERETRSASGARTWLREFLHRTGIPEATQADAVLVVSELVTNALRHGLGQIVTRASVRRDGDVDVSVTDSGPEQPHLMEFDPQRVGRGRPPRRRPGGLGVGGCSVPRRQDGLGPHRGSRRASAGADRQDPDGAETRTPWGRFVAGSPSRWARPPNTTATIRNQPQPTARPPISRSPSGPRAAPDWPPRRWRSGRRRRPAAPGPGGGGPARGSGPPPAMPPPPPRCGRRGTKRRRS